MATHDARGYLAWTLLGIIFFLRSLHSKFMRFSFYGERVFDRKAASSTIGAHICLFLWHVEHLSMEWRRVYHIGAIAAPF